MDHLISKRKLATANHNIFVRIPIEYARERGLTPKMLVGIYYGEHDNELVLKFESEPV